MNGVVFRNHLLVLMVLFFGYYFLSVCDNCTVVAIISLIGGVIGIVIGNYLIHHLAGNFDLLSKLGAYASISLLNVLYSIIAMLIGVGVCLIGAAIPVIRLAKLEPLLAIKED